MKTIGYDPLEQVLWLRRQTARTSAAMVSRPARFNSQQRRRSISSAHGASQPAGAGASRDALSLLHVGLSRYTADHKTCSKASSGRSLTNNPRSAGEQIGQQTGRCHATYTLHTGPLLAGSTKPASPACYCWVRNKTLHGHVTCFLLISTSKHIHHGLMLSRA